MQLSEERSTQQRKCPALGQPVEANFAHTNWQLAYQTCAAARRTAMDGSSRGGTTQEGSVKGGRPSLLHVQDLFAAAEEEIQTQQDGSRRGGTALPAAIAPSPSGSPGPSQHGALQLPASLIERLSRQSTCMRTALAGHQLRSWSGEKLDELARLGLGAPLAPPPRPVLDYSGRVSSNLRRRCAEAAAMLERLSQPAAGSSGKGVGGVEALPRAALRFCKVIAARGALLPAGVGLAVSSQARIHRCKTAAAPTTPPCRAWRLWRNTRQVAWPAAAGGTAYSSAASPTAPSRPLSSSGCAQPAWASRWDTKQSRPATCCRCGCGREAACLLPTCCLPGVPPGTGFSTAQISTDQHNIVLHPHPPHWRKTAVRAAGAGIRCQPQERDA